MPKLRSAILLALPLLCHAGVCAGDGNVPPALAAQAVADPALQPRDAEPRRLAQPKPQPNGRARTSEPPSSPKQASYRGGKADADASRCDMARDIKNDKLAHSNGMPIDANDLQTAENDIRRFCR